MGRNARTFPVEGKTRLSRRVRNFHDLTAGGTVNRLVSSDNRQSGHGIRPSRCWQQPDGLSRCSQHRAAASENKRPSGRFFHVTDIRRYLISSASSRIHGPGRPAAPLPPRARARLPGPSEASPSINIPCQCHKGATGGTQANRVVRPQFRPTGREAGRPGSLHEHPDTRLAETDQPRAIAGILASITGVRLPVPRGRPGHGRPRARPAAHPSRCERRYPGADCSAPTVPARSASRPCPRRRVQRLGADLAAAHAVIQRLVMLLAPQPEINDGRATRPFIGPDRFEQIPRTVAEAAAPGRRSTMGMNPLTVPSRFAASSARNP